ncbi:uncharacterized protein [Aegilops tauschii subsp. strangulata]|uniref:uncharacterized protein n=1 Tax=Aegilops tauschii subsp. strangulata TaxID=200361 RepID=UPI00098A71D9|nr:uncharacterized protein LOC109735771 [Aegilops tauschii subsp. strangulata]
MPTPGGYALVLDPTLVVAKRTCKFLRVLIYGGSSINILYRDTMTKLSIEAKQLKPTRMVFHGIVPSLSCSPIGWIRLDTLFGTSDHFRREPIWFEVVDLSSPYHMKMPGPKGLVTIVDDYKKSLECARASAKLDESLVIAKERRQLDRIVALADEQPAMPAPAKESAGEASFQPSKDTKKIPLNPSDPSYSKYIVVGTSLSST